MPSRKTTRSTHAKSAAAKKTINHLMTKIRHELTKVKTTAPAKKRTHRRRTHM